MCQLPGAFGSFQSWMRIIWIVFCWVFSVIDAYRIGRALGQPDRHGSLRTLG